MAAEYSLIGDDEYLQPVPERVNQVLPQHLERKYSLVKTISKAKLNVIKIIKAIIIARIVAIILNV